MYVTRVCIRVRGSYLFCFFFSAVSLLGHEPVFADYKLAYYYPEASSITPVLDVKFHFLMVLFFFFCVLVVWTYRHYGFVFHERGPSLGLPEGV